MVHLLLKYRWIIFLCASLLVIMLLGCYRLYLNSPIFSNNTYAATIGPQYTYMVQWLGKHTEWQQKGTKTGWAGFDKVYFISLPSRLSNVQQVAERMGVSKSAWILKAIYKDALNINELVSLNIVDKKYLEQLTPRRYGCIGCQLSHLAVMLDCYKDPAAQTCVIFEDDLYKPAKSVTSQVNDFRARIEKLNINWDILYLDYCAELGGGKTKQDVRRLLGSSCAHAYVIKKTSIPIILAASTPMRMAFDLTTNQLMKRDAIIAVGPDKARYFSQNRTFHGSTLDPGFKDYPTLNTRLMQ